MITVGEFRKLPAIASFFPLVFASGARWEKITAKCNVCKKSILPDNLRGRVTHPFSSVYSIEAVGYCPGCDLLTPIQYRMHSDMSMTGLHKGWWCLWEAKSESWIRRLWKVIWGHW